MIGILIFTHGDLCMVLRNEAERLSGRRDQVHCLSMRDGETVEMLTERVDEAVLSLDQGEGVLAVCDVAGGTPWNVCGFLQRERQRKVKRIGGVSMPVIVKALQDHGEHTDLEAWAHTLAEYGSARMLSD